MDAKPFLTAQWRYLAMLNYEVPAAVLLPRVPAGTELDGYQGRVYVSMVGFLFEKTRVYGVGVPFHRDFEEVNLRFYVRRHHPEGWRRGVVFVREIVPRMAIAAVARWFYNENYWSMPMRHRIHDEGDSRRVGVEYHWRHGKRWNLLEAEAEGAPARPVPGSLTHFITEHYWGYSLQPGGGCLEYRVEHPTWEVWPASSARLEMDAKALYGEELGASLEGPPDSAFIALGSSVRVHRGVPLA